MSTMLSAANLGLVGCDACSLVCVSAPSGEQGFCPRCGEALHSRRKHALQRSWGLIIAALLCYIPANALPVLRTNMLGSTEDDTILGGVVLLYNSGSWPLALIVLVASVAIPLGKLVALSYLLLQVQRGRVTSTRDKTKLFRVVEVIGKWSMLDVFVDAYTVAMVQLQPLMSVEPGPGIVFFAAVVVLTVLAAEYFDPRLIWDAEGGVVP